jgi:hypothetical protein
MENSDNRLKQLSRSDRIREEAKRALEFGLTPKRSLSLHPAFRVEALARAPHPSCFPENAPGEQFLKLASVKVVSSRSNNPLIAKENPRYLADQIDYELKRSSNPQQTGKILELLGSLTSAEPNSQTTETLRRRVLTQLFGERYFQSEHDLPKERGSRARGSSIFSTKGKEA